VDIVVNYPQVKYLSCFDTLSIKSYW
jgi:hypothetical protein